MCRAGGRRCPNAGGRFTQNTRQAVSRARRALRDAHEIGNPAEITAARQRLADARTAHQEAKTAAARHDHGTAGHDGDVTAARVLRPPTDPPSSARPLGDGSTGDTELLTYPDGTRLVRKRNGTKAHYRDADPVKLTDAEELAPHVLAAVGLPHAAVHRTAPDEVLMEYVHGRSGTELTGGRHVPDDYSGSPDGRLLGLVDHVIANRDRNTDNWIQTHDGRLIGIDHGEAFNADPFTTSPFAHTLYDHTERTPTPRANEFTPADMHHLGQRLAALRPEFDKRGRSDWHDSMMRRHHDLAQHATGTTDLITRHHRAEENAATPHHNEDQDHTTAHRDTTGHSGDVTPPPTTDDTATAPSTQDAGTHRHGGFMIRNTNNVHGNAHVGSQHDIHHGDGDATRSTRRARPTTGDDRDTTDHADRNDTTNGHDEPHGTHNIASGNDHVTQQVGFTLADLRRLRRR
ncbi:hypothetical protein [Saccharothrix sp. Mg75]|uniref:DUF4398 domain-containing protein n=1 Tax=Saccharothrix sp. Mg75 TaxID=3445357 RepID=UPI003EEEAF8D